MALNDIEPGEWICDGCGEPFPLEALLGMNEDDDEELLCSECLYK